MSVAAVRDEIRKVAALIETARRLLDGGTMVDLSALEGKVRVLCAAVAGLPPEDGRPLVPGLESLLAGLDRLAEALQTHHGRLVAAGGPPPGLPPGRPFPYR